MRHVLVGARVFGVGVLVVGSATACSSSPPPGPTAASPSRSVGPAPVIVTAEVLDRFAPNYSGLGQVSCPATTTCYVPSGDGTASRTHITWKYDGTSWTRLAEGATVPTTMGCTSGDGCQGVVPGIGAVTLNGTGWSPLPSELGAIGGGDRLEFACAVQGVACAAISGDRGYYSFDGWRGPAAIDARLAAVSCGGSMCVAVGDGVWGLVDKDGAWTVHEDLPGNADLVACNTTASCVALDGGHPASSYLFDGSSWRTIPGPGIEGSAGGLLSCGAYGPCVYVDRDSGAVASLVIAQGSWSTARVFDALAHVEDGTANGAIQATSMSCATSYNGEGVTRCLLAGNSALVFQLDSDPAASTYS